jgi:hypothetical protein
LRKAGKAVQPAEAAPDHLATWQEHKAFACVRQVDHLKLDSLIKRFLRGLIAGASLIKTMMVFGDARKVNEGRGKVAACAVCGPDRTPAAQFASIRDA